MAKNLIFPVLNVRRMQLETVRIRLTTPEFGYHFYIEYLLSDSLASSEAYFLSDFF